MDRKQLLRAWLIFLAPPVLVGFIIGSYPGYRLYSWAWKDASFCLSCHVHDYASLGWAKSVHGQTTTCHDCHHQAMRDYIRESYVMLVHRPKFPKDLDHTPYVKKELCAACHITNAADRSTITGPMAFEDIANIPKVDKSKLHALHLGKTTQLTLLNSHELSDAERDPNDPKPPAEFPRTKGDERPITCADCHGGPGNRGHNFSAVDASCVRCHQEPHETKVGMEFGCRACHFHQFMIPIAPKDGK